MRARPLGRRTAIPAMFCRRVTLLLDEGFVPSHAATKETKRRARKASPVEPERTDGAKPERRGLS